MNSSGLSRSSSISDIKPLRRPPPVGRGVDARRIQSTMSEPRPLRSATQRAVPATPIPDHVKNGAGISFSPIKGRRIQLQRPASPAPAPVVAPAPLSPKPPPPPAVVSNITMQWLQSGPATPRHQRVAESSPDSAERELKKRKRLQAFVDTSVGLASPSKNKNKSPLKPVEVKGMGRLALHPKELKVEWVTVATPRRSGKRRGKRRANDGTPSHRKKLTAFGLDVREDPLKAKRRRPPGVQSDSEDEDSDADHPAWPDQEYPWSETKPKQRELSPGERARIQQLERFFDRGTDDEDSEDDYDGAVLPVVEQAPPPPVPRVPSTGGKLGSRPTLGNTPLLSRSMSAASDQGDARAAIFARQKDRPSIGRSSSGQVEVGVAEYIPSDANDNDAVAVDPDSQDEEEDDGIINCLCGKEHADVPMVRCDSCHTWTHLECVGIEDESQLADEWFCYNCEQRKLAEQAEDLPVEPTFTLTTETPRPRIPAYMKFYNPFGGFTDTPLFPSNTSDVRGMTLKPPVTPKTSTFSSSRFRTPSWDTSAFPSNNLITPRTPNMQKQLDMRAYTTPKFFPGEKDNAPAGPSHFDPLSTPSRGLDLGTPFLHSSSSDRYFTGANPNPPTTPLHRIIPNAFPQSSGMTDALLRRPVMYFPGTGGGSPTHSTPPAPFPTITTKGKEALRNPALS
ncbi:hypothetical protein DL93DRAFT_1906570 [Clavulina sp. PMI_390]|nr:hypothetical protein DL93DRAFT_1906570 [Clavulina sp. PMI_390]